MQAIRQICFAKGRPNKVLQPTSTSLREGGGRAWALGRCTHERTLDDL